MEVIIATKEFERIGLIEDGDLIWASRYYKSGDFELHVPATNYNLSLISEGYYVIKSDDDDNVGVIEDIDIENTVDEGDKLIVTGKFAEGFILGSRVVSQQTTLNGNIQEQCRNLVNMNLINATDENRNISFVNLGNLDEAITDKLEIQITGDNLLTKIEEICEAKGLGFKMPMRNDNLYFEMYKGIDRSYNQYENNWIIFSDEYDNLKEAKYQKMTSTMKNFAYVAGEGEGLNRKIVPSYNSSIAPKGIDRFEIWVDQRNMSSNDGEISDEELTAQMKEEGLENLTTITTTFEGTISLSGYKYAKPQDGGDIYLGDIVSIQKKNWNNLYINARIIEVIESYDENGKTTVLTFGL